MSNCAHKVISIQQYSQFLQQQVDAAKGPLVIHEQSFEHRASETEMVLEVEGTSHKLTSDHLQIESMPDASKSLKHDRIGLRTTDERYCNEPEGMLPALGYSVESRRSSFYNKSQMQNSVNRSQNALFYSNVKLQFGSADEPGSPLYSSFVSSQRDTIPIQNDGPPVGSHVELKIVEVASENEEDALERSHLK